ncbi:MAG: pyridoxal phosphate-dependent aminotransferase [Steroidobacteraceae bacterium]
MTQSSTSRVRSAGPTRPPEARSAVHALPLSKVRAIANAGSGRSDVLRFWFGESSRPTPDYITREAIRALEAGRTFYTHNSGIAELRSALATYLTRLHGKHIADARVSVTSSGVSALNIAMQAVLEPGDEAVVVTPVWPNVAAIPQSLGASVKRVALDYQGGKWALDLERLLASVTAATRLLVVNSPNNPTGWVLPEEDRLPILEHCRNHGVWLFTDDVYERLMLGNAAAPAPSFVAIADPHDRVIGVNSFSKAWLMTGWRLGWLVAPAELEEDLAKLIEFNTSCAPEFIQRAGLAAVEQGEPHIAALRADLTACRDVLVSRLSGIQGLDVPVPEGGMYLFFRRCGERDSVSLARRLIAEAGLGLAPGAAFGPEGEGWLRWCFAADPDTLRRGAEKFADWHGRPR